MIYLSITYLSAKRIFGARIFVNINKQNKKKHLVDLLQRSCSYRSLKTSDIYILICSARVVLTKLRIRVCVQRDRWKKIATTNYY